MCLSVISAQLYAATPGAAAAVADSTKLLADLNPVTGALDGLIGEAAGKADAVLQRQLEHLRAIIQEALFDLDQVAKKNVDRLDAAAVKEITLLNQYVRENLVQFDVLVGKRLNQIDQATFDRINQFNFGLANVLASLKILNTVFLIQTGKDGMGITTFAQAGDVTRLYISGSGFTKHGKPSAYIAGPKVKPDYFGVLGKAAEVEVTNASMGLLEVDIPNRFIPNDFGPNNMSLEIKVPSGLISSDKQSIPLHVCGSLPRVFLTVKLQASGMHYVRSTAPLRDLLHAACTDGNNNNEDHVCLPPSPPEGYEFDLADGKGIVYGGENGNNKHEVVWHQPSQYCLKAYCEGINGNAHENIQGVSMKLMKREALSPCAPAQTLPVSNNDPSKVSPLELNYYTLQQLDLSDPITKTVGDCSELANVVPPKVTATLDLANSSRVVFESVSLVPGSTAKAQTLDADFTLGTDNRLNVMATPKCEFHLIPRTQSTN